MVILCLIFCILLGELSEIFEEKDALKGEVTNRLKELKESSVLTFYDLLEFLNEEQLTDLFQKAPYSKWPQIGKVTKRLNKKTFTDQKIVTDTIDSIKVEIEYLFFHNFFTFFSK